MYRLDPPIPPEETSLYLISREEIETCNPDRLLADLAISAANPFVQAGPRRLEIAVNGYNDDPRELLEIPEFIRFAKKAEAGNPCWLYFSGPQSGWARLICQACHRAGRFTYTPKGLLVPVKVHSLQRFIERQVDDFSRLCHLAGLDARATCTAFEEAMADASGHFLDAR